MNNNKKILAICHEYPFLGFLAPIFNDIGIKVHMVALNNEIADDLPDDPSAYDGVVIFGSKESVYDVDNLPWLQNEIDWIKNFLNSGKPVLGICFGCQILTHIYGGTVHLGSKGTSFGFRRLSVVGDDPIFGKDLDGCLAYTAHNDTFTPAPQAEHLAKNEFYPNQAFKFADNVYGVQFHPEATADEAVRWRQGRQQAGTLPDDAPSVDNIYAQFAKNEVCVLSWLKGFIERLFL